MVISDCLPRGSGFFRVQGLVKCQARYCLQLTRLAEYKIDLLNEGQADRGEIALQDGAASPEQHVVKAGRGARVKRTGRGDRAIVDAALPGDANPLRDLRARCGPQTLKTVSETS